MLAALVASGFAARPFAFAGFLPRKGGERTRSLAALAAFPGTLVLFEAPNRAAATLADLARVLGPRRAVLARELTKVHETLTRGRLGEVELDDPRGELTIVVEGPDPAVEAEAAPPPDLDAEVRRLLADGRSPRDAARELAERFGIPRREAYARVLAHGRTPVPRGIND
jgi:16S rRNA (cytidine1402-2'-O)-methyltransferase